ncbi:MAG: hypothetical protein D6681_18210, partial [Calditrichaeota bacterium]
PERISQIKSLKINNIFSPINGFIWILREEPKLHLRKRLETNAFSDQFVKKHPLAKITKLRDT